MDTNVTITDPEQLLLAISTPQEGRAGPPTPRESPWPLAAAALMAGVRDLPGPARGVDMKNTAGKARLDLFPWLPLPEVVKASEFGATKYDAHTYLHSTSQLKYWNAAQRHMIAWVCGNTLDPESGLHAIDHAILSLLMLRSVQMVRPDSDDRHRMRGE